MTKGRGEGEREGKGSGRGAESARPIRLGIVATEFNAEIVDGMLEMALSRAKERGAEVTSVVRVPGAFDAPFAVQRLLRRADVDAVVTLGAVVQGETHHDVILMESTARTLQELGLRFDKPVTLGIAGPRMTWAQAKARIAYAARAVDAALALARA